MNMQNALKQLISDSQNKYWKNALWESRNPLLIENKEWFENLRSGYFFLMSLNGKEDRVLDIKAGSGIISDVISTYAKEVVSMEYEPCMTEFLKIRFEQDMRENINIVHASPIYLPFKSNIFDLVIINFMYDNLLKYSISKRAQLDFFKKCFDVLKKRGKIIIQTENSMSPHNILCRLKKNCNTFNRKKITNLFEVEIKNNSYVYWMTSLFAYKRLLGKAGFNKIKSYIISPTGNNPMIILPMDDDNIIKKVFSLSDSFPQNKIKKIIYIFLLKSGMLKYFMHSFYIVAEKT
jgi:ubiquinone/menaquinone biosynthesis C-methylase UbiE